MAPEWAYFNKRLSTFIGNWPWALKSKNCIFKADAFKGRSLCVCMCTCTILCSRIVCAGESGQWICLVLYCLLLSSAHLTLDRDRVRWAERGGSLIMGWRLGSEPDSSIALVSCLFCLLRWMNEREHERTLDDQSTRSHASTDHRALRWKTTERTRNISLSQISVALFTPGINISSEPITSGQVRQITQASQTLLQWPSV